MCFFSPKRKSVRSRSIRRARFGFQFYCLQLRTDVLVHKITAPQGMVTKELIPDSRAVRLWIRALWRGHPFWRHQLLYFSEAKKKQNQLHGKQPPEWWHFTLIPCRKNMAGWKSSYMHWRDAYERLFKEITILSNKHICGCQVLCPPLKKCQNACQFEVWKERTENPLSTPLKSWALFEAQKKLKSLWGKERDKICPVHACIIINKDQFAITHCEFIRFPDDPSVFTLHPLLFSPLFSHFHFSLSYARDDMLGHLQTKARWSHFFPN